MDKQRLLELAGVTEAKYVGSTDSWIIVEIMDVGEFEAMGPFSSKQLAQRFVNELIRRHDLDIDTLYVVRISSPDEAMGT